MFVLPGCDMRESHRTALNPPYTVELISTEEGIAALENDWNRLTDRAESPNVFMTYDWFRAWTKELRSDDGSGRLQFYVLSIKQNATIVGIAPLVRRIVSRSGLRVRKLEFVTYHSDYNEFVVGNDVRSLSRAVMDFLARSKRDWDLLDLTDLRDQGDTIAAMETAAVSARLPYKLFPEEIGCPYMPIDAPWSETWKRRRLLFARRASERLEKSAAEGYRVRFVDQPHLERKLLQRIIAVEAQKHVGGQLSAPFIGRYPEVFQSLFDALGPRGFIVIVLVEKHGELVAWDFHYRCGSKLWGYLTAYNHAFAHLSPGTVLLCNAIDYGFAHGCDEFDFLRGMDKYKMRWTSSVRRNRRMILWNRRWISRLAALALLRQRARLLSQSSTPSDDVRPANVVP